MAFTFCNQWAENFVNAEIDVGRSAVNGITQFIEQFNSNLNLVNISSPTINNKYIVLNKSNTNTPCPLPPYLPSELVE